jgi:hypothetical protein
MNWSGQGDQFGSYPQWETSSNAFYHNYRNPTGLQKLGEEIQCEYQIKAFAEHLVRFPEYEETREKILAGFEEGRGVCFQLLHRLMRRLGYKGAAGFAHKNPEKFQEIFEGEFLFNYRAYHPSQDPRWLVGNQLDDSVRGGDTPLDQCVNGLSGGEEASDDEAGAPSEEFRRGYLSAAKEIEKHHEKLSKRVEGMEAKLEQTISSKMRELTEQIEHLRVSATAVPAVSHDRNELAACGVAPRVLSVRAAETGKMQTEPARLGIPPGDSFGAPLRNEGAKMSDPNLQVMLEGVLKPLAAAPMSAGPPAGTPLTAPSSLKSILSSEDKLSKIQASENREAESPEIQAIHIPVGDWPSKTGPMDLPTAHPITQLKKLVLPALAQNQLSSSMATIPPPPTTGLHALPLFTNNPFMNYSVVAMLRGARGHDQGYARVNGTFQKDLDATDKFLIDQTAPTGESPAGASASTDVGDAGYRC